MPFARVALPFVAIAAAACATPAESIQDPRGEPVPNRGFRERFGLVHVNFDTQERTLKDSAHWYQRVIESRGAFLKDAAVSASEGRDR